MRTLRTLLLFLGSVLLMYFATGNIMESLQFAFMVWGVAGVFSLVILSVVTDIVKKR